MKKTIFVLAAIAMVSLTSCSKKEENKAEATQEVTETTNSETTEATSTEVPEFESEKLGEYIKAYDAYMEEYKKVVESKDMTKFQELGTKGQELAKKAQELTSEGLSESDAKKLTDYSNEKAEELKKLSLEMMK